MGRTNQLLEMLQRIKAKAEAKAEKLIKNEGGSGG
jgi:hypothetical protein